MTDRHGHKNGPRSAARSRVATASGRGQGRRRNTSSIVAAWVALALLVAGVALGAFLLIRGFAARSQAAAKKPTTKAATSTADPYAAPGGTAAPAGGSAASSTSPVSPDSGEAAVAPTGNAVAAAALRYPGAPAITPHSISGIHPKHKYIAITLDDGTPFDTRILDMFEQRGWTATTFLLGTMVTSQPTLVARLHRDGFEIANHTWDHKTLTKLSESQVRDELSRTQAAISKITGNQAPYMRPPGGGTNARVKSIAGSMGYNIVLWNKSFADTSGSATPEQCAANALKNLAPGDIILCHWGRPATYGAMKILLPELERRGYRVVTLSEMIADSK